MDDNTSRPLRIKTSLGVTLHAAPFTEGQILAIQQLRSGDASLTMEILIGLIRSSLGETAYRGIIVALAKGDATAKDLVGIITDIANATGDQKQDPADEAAPASVDG